MSKNFTQLPEHIDEQASEWCALMQSGDISPEDQRRLDAWLSEHQDHRQAYKQMQSIWQSLGDLSATPEAAALRQSVQDDSIWARLRQVFSAAASSLRDLAQVFSGRPVSFISAALVLSIAVGLLLVQQPDAPVVNYYATQTGEIQKIVLSDGSQITLGAKSEIKTRIGESDRYAELIRGEAFFDIAKDTAKPFLVKADEVSIEVVGTQFNVLKRYKSINVSVLEGVVNVSEQGAQSGSVEPTAAVLLTVGQQVIKPRSANFEQVATIDVSELGAWRSGRLIFTETALIDVIADASRYFEGKFSMQSNELANQRVTLSLRADQINQLPQMLAQVLPLQFREIPGNIIVLENSVVAD